MLNIIISFDPGIPVHRRRRIEFLDSLFDHEDIVLSWVLSLRRLLGRARSLTPRIPRIPRSEKARLIDLFGSAARFSGILGSDCKNLEREDGTWSEFVESYF